MISGLSDLWRCSAISGRHGSGTANPAGVLRGYTSASAARICRACAGTGGDGTVDRRELAHGHQRSRHVHRGYSRLRRLHVGDPFHPERSAHFGLLYRVYSQNGGAPLDIGDLFKGFNYFVPALVTSLLVGIFVFIGALMCLLPALFVATIFIFPYHFIVDKKMDFWPAMQASHDVVKKDYAGFIVFMLAIIGVNILGVLALVVGLLVTIPMTFAAITVAYRDVVGFEPNPDY